MSSLASKSRWADGHADLVDREISLVRLHATSHLVAMFELLRGNYRRWRCYRMIIAEFGRHPGLADELGISQDDIDRIRGIAHDVAMGVALRVAISR